MPRRLLLTTLLSLFLTTLSYGAGLHFTDEEVTIWRVRKDQGPFKDDWDRIAARASAWKAAPTPRWVGNTTGGCWPDVLENPPRPTDEGLRDAAFYSLVTGDLTYRDAVLAALLAQTRVPGTDWTNTKLWCPTAANASSHPDPANWFRRLTYGYSYIRAGVSVCDQPLLDAWFLAGARYFDGVVNNVITRRFPGRQADNYTCTDATVYCPGENFGTTHFGGPMTNTLHSGWHNQMAATAAAPAAVGAMLNDTPLKNNAKRFVREWITYATWPGGQIVDQYRWNGVDILARGYRYPGMALGSVITIADHIARTGDLEPYTFFTFQGLYGTQGGPKSLLNAMRHYSGQTLGGVIEYASAVCTSDPNKIIDPVMPGENPLVPYVNLAPANIFYQAEDIKAAYTKAIPPVHAHIGCDVLGGDWCSYPAIRFMFGHQEGIVWPYLSPPQ